MRDSHALQHTVNFQSLFADRAAGDWGRRPRPVENHTTAGAVSSTNVAPGRAGQSWVQAMSVSDGALKMQPLPNRFDIESGDTDELNQRRRWVRL
jgi:hypothetical protein